MEQHILQKFRGKSYFPGVVTLVSNSPSSDLGILIRHGANITKNKKRLFLNERGKSLLEIKTLKVLVIYDALEGGQ